MGTSIDLNKRNVLIYGMDYWPDATGIAPYTTGLAEHLVTIGDRVDVVAGMPYYPEWKVKSGYARKLRTTEDHGGVTIHRSRQYVPISQSSVRRAAFEASFFVNATFSGLRPRPDVVIAVLPALSDGVLAARTARKHHVPLILIIQDLLGQAALQSGVRGGQRVAKQTARLEGWIARQASAIGIVAEGFRAPLEALGVASDQIHRIRNWTHIRPVTADRATTRAILGLPENACVVLHAGNMGLKQGLDNVIDAARVAQTTDPGILFTMLGDGNQRASLESRAQDLPNVRFIDPVDEEIFANALAAADILLVNQLPTVIDMSLPSKLTSYLATGRPVIAAVASASETARAVLQSGGGQVVEPGNPTALVDAIVALAGDPVHGDLLGQRGQAYAANVLSAEGALSHITSLVHDDYSTAPRGAQEALSA